MFIECAHLWQREEGNIRISRSFTGYVSKTALNRAPQPRKLASILQPRSTPPQRVCLGRREEHESDIPRHPGNPVRSAPVRTLVA